MTVMHLEIRGLGLGGCEVYQQGGQKTGSCSNPDMIKEWRPISDSDINTQIVRGSIKKVLKLKWCSWDTLNFKL